MSKQWIVGWGNGLTGPTTPAVTPFCGGNKWDHLPVSCGMETIAVVPKQDCTGGEILMKKHAKLIAAAPDLLEALQAIINSVPFSSSHQETFERAQAAVKKATE